MHFDWPTHTEKANFYNYKPDPCYPLPFVSGSLRKWKLFTAEYEGGVMTLKCPDGHITRTMGCFGIQDKCRDVTKGNCLGQVGLQTSFLPNLLTNKQIHLGHNNVLHCDEILLNNVKKNKESFNVEEDICEADVKYNVLLANNEQDKKGLKKTIEDPELGDIEAFKDQVVDNDDWKSVEDGEEDPWAMDSDNSASVTGAIQSKNYKETFSPTLTDKEKPQIFHTVDTSMIENKSLKVIESEEKARNVNVCEWDGDKNSEIYKDTPSDKLINEPETDYRNRSRFFRKQYNYTIEDNETPYILTLEEAYFLSYALGCLVVEDKKTNTFINLLKLWRLFQEADSFFVPKYAVYHHFRSQGWIARDATKFGGHYLLYKDGPEFYHSSLLVIIQAVTENYSGELKCDNRFIQMKHTWPTTFGAERIAQSTNKSLVICYAIFPKDINLNTPHCLKQIKIQEMAVKRFTWTDEREEN